MEAFFDTNVPSEQTHKYIEFNKLKRFESW